MQSKLRFTAQGMGAPAAAVLLGLGLAGLCVKLCGYPVWQAIGAMWSGATGLVGGPAVSRLDVGIAGGLFHWNRYLGAQSLSRFTPLLLCGLSVALALRAGMFNIGAQGQMLLGALAAALAGVYGAGLPSVALIPAVALAGCAAGALTAAAAGSHKALRGVHEVISTIMLNYIAADLASYLVTHQLKDPGSMAAQTREMSHGAWLAPLTPGSGLTAGLLLALAAAAWYGFLLRRTAVGYEIRAVGLGQAAARAAGLPVQRTMILSMALAGALAGLAGALEVMGIHHRYVEGVAGTYGFDGIAVALLGGLATAPVILSALFFAALVSGAAYMELQTGVPSSIAVVIQAVVIVAVGVRVLGRPTAIEPAPESALYAAEERHIPDSGGE